MLDENLQIKSLRFRLKCDNLFDIYYKSVFFFFLIWFSIFVFVNFEEHSAEISVWVIAYTNNIINNTCVFTFL